MFSNAKKFFKKNKLMVVIVLAVLIIITLYLFYVNVKEGFDQQSSLTKAKIIPVSTVEKIYNQLPKQTFKDIAKPMVELYKLFVANYKDAFDVSSQIVKVNQAVEAATNNIKDPEQPPPRSDEAMDYSSKAYQDYSAAWDVFRMEMNENQKSRDKIRMQILQKEGVNIKPGIERVMTNAIKWLPNAKQYYDTFVLNNYYGLYDGTFGPTNFGQNPETARNEFANLAIMVANTLYTDNQLSVLIGPVQLPFDMPIVKKGADFISTAGITPDLYREINQYFQKYIQNLISPFYIIVQYLSRETNNYDGARIGGLPIDGTIIDTIVKMITQLNDLTKPVKVTKKK